MKFDTRVTVLGHVQRGGFASAFDRYLGTRMGSEAVLTLMNAKPEHAPVVIGINGNQICHLPLIESVKKCNLLAEALKAKKFDEVVELRGPSFKRHLETCLQLSKITPKLKKDDVSSTSSSTRFKKFYHFSFIYTTWQWLT